MDGPERSVHRRWSCEVAAIPGALLKAFPLEAASLVPPVKGNQIEGCRDAAAVREFSLEEGRCAVDIARSTVDRRVGGKPVAYQDFKDIPPRLRDRGGAFVTINTFPDRELRGCIGIPEPVMPLVEAIVQAGGSAALEDSRFDPVSPPELDRIVVEVSLLTNPEQIKVARPADLLLEVVIGRDGLIAELGGRRGLLLPQVAVERRWGVEEFIMHTCGKAGIPERSWKDPKVRFSRFRGQVFDEEKPRGGVVARSLAP